MSQRLRDKVIVVTGGTSGLGEAAGRALARAGARVLLTARTAERGEALARAIRSDGGEATFLAHDVADQARWRDVIRWGLDRYGRLDGLLNNAGFAETSLLEATSCAQFRRQHQVNLHGVFYGLTQAASVMRTQDGGGAIVNVASIGGLTGNPMASAYCSAKGAVRYLGKLAARELGSHGIRVNTIYPGVFETPLAERTVVMSAEARTQVLAVVPMRRLGMPEEFAHMVVYLFSEEARGVNGADLVVDGGLTAV